MWIQRCSTVLRHHNHHSNLETYQVQTNPFRANCANFSLVIKKTAVNSFRNLGELLITHHHNSPLSSCWLGSINLEWKQRDKFFVPCSSGPSGQNKVDRRRQPDATLLLPPARSQLNTWDFSQCPFHTIPCIFLQHEKGSASRDRYTCRLLLRAPNKTNEYVALVDHPN